MREIIIPIRADVYFDLDRHCPLRNRERADLSQPNKLVHPGASHDRAGCRLAVTIGDATADRTKTVIMKWV
jgi:hypothetical protein